MMKKEWYMKTIVGVVALTICLLVAESCKKSDDKAVKIIERRNKTECTKRNYELAYVFTEQKKMIILVADVIILIKMYTGRKNIF